MPSPNTQLCLPRMDPHKTLVLLDLDGVVNNPNLGQQKPDRTVLEYIVGIQRKGAQVASATGRPLAWVEDNVFPLLPTGARCPLQIVAAENGAVLASGRPGNLTVDQSNLAHYKVPKVMLAAAKQVEQESEGHLFLDPQKLAMVSVFERPGCHGFKGWFDTNAPRLKAWLEGQLTSNRLADNFIVNHTTIALDIQHRDGSKVLASAGIARQLGDASKQFMHAFAVGDSNSDIDLLREAANNFPGATATFYYVGEGSPPSCPGIHVLAIPGYSNGTLKILRAIDQAMV